MPANSLSEWLVHSAGMVGNWSTESTYYSGKQQQIQTGHATLIAEGNEATLKTQQNTETRTQIEFYKCNVNESHDLHKAVGRQLAIKLLVRDGRTNRYDVV